MTKADLSVLDEDILTDITDIKSYGNYSISASVASNALTISLKDRAGNNPSAISPISFDFRDPTIANGGPVRLNVTSALSLVISSGSTLGTVNNVPFRLWLVLFNDGGTARLGVINCRNSLNTIYPLRENRLLGSTAEGGAANLAHVLYTGTAVTGKAFRILGFLEWASGLTTVGTWATPPTTIQLLTRGVSLPGEIIQVVSASAGTTFTNNSVNAYADTALTANITPTSSVNIVGIEFSGNMMSSVNNTECYARLHRGGTPVGQTVTIYTLSGGITIWPVSGKVVDFPGSTALITYVVRIMSLTNGNQVRWNYQPGEAVMQITELQS